MRRTLALALAGLLASGDTAIAQKSATPAPTTTNTATPAAEAEEPARAPLPNTLMDGTAIKLRLSETVSSADAHVGQQVPFETTEDVSVQGTVVIPKGSAALATVTEAQPKRRMGRGGKLDVNIDSVRLADGEKVQLRAVKNTQGGGHVGAMTGAMVATGIVFFPAAPLFLFMHGKDITIPKGTEITAFVQGDMKLEMAKFLPATPANDAFATVRTGNAPLPATTVAPVTASLAVESNPSGADIEVDGNFMGNTPSTLSLPPGQHTITVKKKGMKDWTRAMNVAGSGVHLNAELETK